MSNWTHIVGVFHVETFTRTENLQKYVEDALKDAPKITGSERDASVFVNAERGHNVSVSCDCDRCEYGATVEYLEDGFSCAATADYECPRGKYQTRAIITVQGDLRDRMRPATKKEWNAFHRYIAKTLGWDIRIATCRIDGR